MGKIKEHVINDVEIEIITDELEKILDELYFLDHPQGVELADRVGEIIDELNDIKGIVK